MNFNWYWWILISYCVLHNYDIAGYFNVRIPNSVINFDELPHIIHLPGQSGWCGVIFGG